MCILQINDMTLLSDRPNTRTIHLLTYLYQLLEGEMTSKGGDCRPQCMDLVHHHCCLMIPGDLDQMSLLLHAYLLTSAIEI